VQVYNVIDLLVIEALTVEPAAPRATASLAHPDVANVSTAVAKIIWTVSEDLMRDPFRAAS
jgi:hypothetical protein